MAPLLNCYTRKWLLFNPPSTRPLSTTSETNCKDKLNTLEIWKREDQKLFLDAVFGIDEEAVLESDCKNYLEERLKSVQPLFDEAEKRLTSTSLPLHLFYYTENINAISSKTTLTSGGFNFRMNLLALFVNQHFYVRRETKN